MNKAQGRRQRRKATSYQKYRNSDTRRVNKCKRLAKTIKNHPNDKCAIEALKRAEQGK